MRAEILVGETVAGERLRDKRGEQGESRRAKSAGAVVLEKDRAYSAFEEQQSLVAISRELSSILELEKLLPTILSSLRNIARYDRAILCLLDEEGKNVQRYGEALEWEPLVNQGGAIPIRQSLCGRAIQT